MAHGSRSTPPAGCASSRDKFDGRPMTGSAACRRGVAALFEPKSIVMIGVSQRESNLGRRALRHLQLHGFSGSLSVVHPTADEIAGIPARRSLAELDDVPDLAVVCTHGDAA